MSQTSISEIREQYNNKNKLNRYSIILIAIFFVLGLFLILINYEYYLNIILIALIIVMFVFIIFSPQISEYDLIRYHLAELITYLEDTNFKKSEANIDKLAFSLNELYYGIDDSFLFLSIKSNVGDLWNLLKYQIYPCLKDDDYNSYIETLKDINNAFDTENLTFFDETIHGAINDISESDEQNAILFPYEKPNFLNQIIKSSTKSFKTQFEKNIIVRVSILILIFSVIGYYISINLSNITFDNSLFGPIILLSGAIAIKMGK